MSSTITNYLKASMVAGGAGLPLWHAAATEQS